jgi:hypothetical protein
MKIKNFVGSQKIPKTEKTWGFGEKCSEVRKKLMLIQINILWLSKKKIKSSPLATSPSCRPSHSREA